MFMAQAARIERARQSARARSPGMILSSSAYFGGRSQPEIRLNFPFPWYWKNCVWSLQTAGMALYLPHRTLGAPSATGPRNARACFMNACAVIFVPIAFSHFTVVRTWAKVTGVHGSAVSVSFPYLLKTARKGGTPLSVRSKPSDDAIA